jgi:hypothetical protein
LSNGGWRLTFLSKDIIKQSENFSLLKISASVDIIFDENVLDHVVNDISVIFFGNRFIEAHNELSHLWSGDNVISVDINFIEESIE